MRPAAGAFAALLAAASPAAAQDGYVQRLRLMAQLQTLNAELLSQDSATAVLQTRCDRIDPGERIRARKLQAPDELRAAAAARRVLGVAESEPIRLRRVELMCGEAVLSAADNWYLPGRLTPEMNMTLQTTERPFGVVVRPLAFQRRTFSARLLFSPLPPGWEAQPPSRFDAPAAPPAYVLQHRALLQTPDGRPFSYLVETYARAVLTP